MKKEKRFIRVLSESGWNGSTQLFVDVETGVNYLFHAEGYAGGLTVLRNADGTPVVTPKEDLKALREGK